MNGILIIDKPKGMTSHDVVARIRRILICNVPTYQRANVPKVGHGGTLDPIATGLLPIFVGSATKLSSTSISGDKEYLATFKFGERTDTDDAEGALLSTEAVPVDLKERLEQILPKFTGLILQLPPQYSAIKIGGERAYKLARHGVFVKMAPRNVEIKSLTIERVDAPFACLRVFCSKGTYIRSLARDMGVELSIGAHVTELRRVKCGQYDISEALSLDKVSTLQDVARMLEVRPN
jgi:tRNA pseudouridine55 synthase